MTQGSLSNEADSWFELHEMPGNRDPSDRPCSSSHEGCAGFWAADSLSGLILKCRPVSRNSQRASMPGYRDTSAFPVLILSTPSERVLNECRTSPSRVGSEISLCLGPER
jgi:hypothetical protein